jgi:predicted AAA+ superfamily ATPase
VVLAETAEEKREILKNIYNTYFLRDIRDIAGLIDDYKLTKLIKGLAAQAGQLVEYREIGNISGYDYLSLKKYLNILEKTFICSPVRPFFRNKRIELVKNPKIYFFDSGLRNFITNNFNRLEKRADKGAVMENYVFTEFIKRELAFNYWRTKQKAEVDFIITVEDLKILPVEVKNNLKKPEISRSFHSFITAYSPDNAVILNQDYIGMKKSGDTEVFFLPFWMIN